MHPFLPSNLPDPVAWLPGWGSDFSIFRATIQDQWPEHSHLFIGYDQMMVYQNRLQDLPQIQAAQTIVAWSLGTCICFQNRSALSSKRLILIGPALGFCSSPHGWPIQNVQQMIRQLQRKPQIILQSFARQITPLEEHAAIREQWVKQAQQYSVPQLVEGLQILQQSIQIPPTNQEQTPQSQIEIWAGTQDRITQLQLAQHISQQLKIPLHTYCGEHWFL